MFSKSFEEPADLQQIPWYQRVLYRNQPEIGRRSTSSPSSSDNQASSAKDNEGSLVPMEDALREFHDQCRKISADGSATVSHPFQAPFDAKSFGSSSLPFTSSNRSVPLALSLGGLAGNSLLEHKPLSSFVPPAQPFYHGYQAHHNYPGIGQKSLPYGGYESSRQQHNQPGASSPYIFQSLEKNTDSPTSTSNGSELQMLGSKLQSSLAKYASSIKGSDLRSAVQVAVRPPSPDYCHLCLDLIGIPPSDLPIFDSDHAMKVHAERHAENMVQPLEKVMKQCFPMIKSSPLSDSGSSGTHPFPSPHENDEISYPEVHLRLSGSLSKLPAEVTCNLKGCRFSLKNEDQNLETHIYHHFGKAYPKDFLFSCKLCGYKGQHISIHNDKHHHNEDVQFSDFREKFMKNLLKVASKCFPVGDFGEKSHSKTDQQDLESVAKQEKEDDFEKLKETGVILEEKKLDDKAPEKSDSLIEFDQMIEAVKSSSSKVICKKCGELMSSSKLESHLYKHFSADMESISLFSCGWCSYEGLAIDHHLRTIHKGKEPQFKDERECHLKLLNNYLVSCFAVEKSLKRKGSPPPVSVPVKRIKSQPIETASELLPEKNLLSSPSKKTSGILQKFLEEVEIVIKRIFLSRSVVYCAAKPCKKLFKKRNTNFSKIEGHVFLHLKKPAFSCKKCAYKGYWIREHIRQVHHKLFGKEEVNSAFADLRSSYSPSELLKVLEEIFPRTCAISPKSIPAVERVKSAKKFMALICGMRNHGSVTCSKCGKIIALSRLNRSVFFKHVALHCKDDRFFACGFCKKSLNCSDVSTHFSTQHKGKEIVFTDTVAAHDEDLVKVFKNCFEISENMPSEAKSKKSVSSQGKDKLQLKLKLYKEKIREIVDQIKESTALSCSVCAKEIILSKQSSDRRKMIDFHIQQCGKISGFKCKLCQTRNTYTRITSHIRKDHPGQALLYEDQLWKYADKLLLQLEACFPSSLKTITCKLERIRHVPAKQKEKGSAQKLTLEKKEESSLKAPSKIKPEKDINSDPKSTELPAAYLVSEPVIHMVKFKEAVDSVKQKWVESLARRQVKSISCNLCAKEIKPKGRVIAEHCYHHSGLNLFQCLLCQVECCCTAEMEAHMSKSHLSEEMTPETVKDIRMLHESTLLSILEACFEADLSVPQGATIATRFHSTVTELFVEMMKSPGEFRCKICKRPIKPVKKSRITDHVISHFPEDMNQCVVCKKGFRSHQKAAIHAQSHKVSVAVENLVTNLAAIHDHALVKLTKQCFISGLSQPKSKSATRKQMETESLKQNNDFCLSTAEKHSGTAKKNKLWKNNAKHAERSYINQEESAWDSDNGARVASSAVAHALESLIVVPCNVPERFEAAVDEAISSIHHGHLEKLVCKACDWSINLESAICSVKEELCQHVYEHFLKEPVFFCKICNSGQSAINKHLLDVHQKFLVQPGDVVDKRLEYETELLETLESCFPSGSTTGDPAPSVNKHQSLDYPGAVSEENKEMQKKVKEENLENGQMVKREMQDEMEMQKSVFEIMMVHLD